MWCKIKYLLWQSIFISCKAIELMLCVLERSQGTNRGISVRLAWWSSYSAKGFSSRGLIMVLLTSWICSFIILISFSRDSICFLNCSNLWSSTNLNFSNSWFLFFRSYICFSCEKYIQKLESDPALSKILKMRCEYGMGKNSSHISSGSLDLSHKSHSYWVGSRGVNNAEIMDNPTNSGMGDEKLNTLYWVSEGKLKTLR